MEKRSNPLVVRGANLTIVLNGDGVLGDEPLLRIEFCGLSVAGLPNEF